MIRKFGQWLHGLLFAKHSIENMPRLSVAYLRILYRCELFLRSVPNRRARSMSSRESRRRDAQLCFVKRVIFLF